MNLTTTSLTRKGHQTMERSSLFLLTTIWKLSTRNFVRANLPEKGLRKTPNCSLTESTFFEMRSRKRVKRSVKLRKGPMTFFL